MTDRKPVQARPRLLLAGVPPNGHAGNSVSTEVLFEALSFLGEVTLLSHRTSALPTWTAAANGSRRVMLGTQPFAVHGEALLAGRLHQARLRSWQAGWAVNSRYASAMYAARVPYVIWEATTIREELVASSFRAIRLSRRGSGFGRALHFVTLPVGERLERALYRNACIVMTMSEHTRQRILSQYDLPADRVALLPHPPAQRFLHVVAARAAHVPPRATRNGTPWRMLFVGRADDPRKNFVLLLNAIRHLRARGREVTLTVVGPHNLEWRQSLDMNGIVDVVTFTGAIPVEQLVDAYLSHEVLVLTSRQEGFGIVVAEAFAAGLPVVATRCGGPEHIIRESGAGVLVEHTADAIADGVEGLLSARGRAVAMSIRAREYSTHALGFEQFSSRVADVTRSLLVEAEHIVGA